MNDPQTTPNRKKSRAGVIGAVAGLAAAGVAAGVAAERYLINKARKDPEDPFTEEPFGRLPADRIRTVDTPDGVSLHVEVVGTRYEAADEALPVAATVVFVHGYCLDMGTFHFQRRALAESTLPVRAVYYDQPGHGQSSRLPTPEYDIDRLSDALYAVIAQAVPTGPVILVGHSMGAMTIMAFARRFGDVFASRVRGVALLSTSAGGLDEVTFGAPKVLARARKLLLPMLGKAAAMTPGAIDRARKIAGDLAWFLTRRYGFATTKPSPALVSYVEDMNTNTPIRTVIGFSRTLLAHDERGSLAALSDVPVLILCGSDDQFTPASHSVDIAEELPHAKLVMVPDSGHVAQLEKPDEVTTPLLDVLSAIVGSIAETIAVGGVGVNAARRKPWRRKTKRKNEDGKDNR